MQIKNDLGDEKKTGGRQDLFPPGTGLSEETLIYFRADANRQVGYGHLMRCLTIADACKTQGMCPVFLTAEEEAQKMIADRGFLCRMLKTDYRDMESELGTLQELLAGGEPVVLDSYFLTGPYVKALKENGHRIVWLDDLGEQTFPVDMLINYNAYAERLAYPVKRKAGADAHVGGERWNDCTYLLGPSYAPVRPAFRRGNCTVRETLGTVLVSAGGSDPYGAGVWFAKQLEKRLPGVKLFVVCGPHAKGKEELRRMAGRNGNIEVIEGCSDLSSVMRRSDLAVTAAGSTLYELCAAGLPCILYYVADNQRMGAETFARETGAVNLGDIRSEGFQTEAEKKLEAELLCLAAASGRQKLADAMHALVDGNGAARIAEALAKLVFVRHT